MHWLGANWFNIVQTVALIVTLAIATSALRSSGRAAEGSNMLAILTSNREVWSQLTTNPKLQSVMRPATNANGDVSDEEYTFFLQVINHVRVVFELAQIGGINPVQGTRRDVHDFMNWPVFKAAWDKAKDYQNADFSQFIDNCMAGIDLDKPLGRRPNLIQQRVQRVRSRLSMGTRESKLCD